MRGAVEKLLIWLFIVLTPKWPNIVCSNDVSFHKIMTPLHLKKKGRHISSTPSQCLSEAVYSVVP